MREGFDPKQLSVDHIIDQSGRVDDVDKARAMANVEAEHRAFAQMFADYCRDPQAFGATHPALGVAEIEWLRQLQEPGVRTEYIKRYGELRAEVEGEVYDFRPSLKNFSIDGLMELRWSLRIATETG
jgi:hypothetical protein